MKSSTYLILLGLASAAQDPYDCIPEQPCKDNMECVKRTILDVENTT